MTELNYLVSSHPSSSSYLDSDGSPAPSSTPATEPVSDTDLAHIPQVKKPQTFLCPTKATTPINITACSYLDPCTGFGISARPSTQRPPLHCLECLYVRTNSRDALKIWAKLVKLSAHWRVLLRWTDWHLTRWPLTGTTAGRWCCEISRVCSFDRKCRIYAGWQKLNGSSFSSGNWQQVDLGFNPCATAFMLRVHLCPTFICPYIIPLPSSSLVVSRLRLKNAHVSTSDGPIESMVEGDLCSSQCCTRVKFHPEKSAPATIQSNPKRNIALGSHSGWIHKSNTINSEVVMSGTVAHYPQQEPERADKVCRSCVVVARVWNVNDWAPFWTKGMHCFLVILK